MALGLGVLLAELEAVLGRLADKAEFLAALALDVNLVSENSPKSESSLLDSLKLDLVRAVAWAMGLAVADFLGATFR